MKKNFTFYFSVASQKKTNTFKFYSSKTLGKITELLKFSLNNSLKSPNKACIDKILKYAK
jgi:hypothetical protein